MGEIHFLQTMDLPLKEKMPQAILLDGFSWMTAYRHWLKIASG